MNQERQTISYERYMFLPIEERKKISSEISAENRALLMKTHVERWLATNHPRLKQEQIVVIEEIIRFITPEAYQEDRDYEKVIQEAERLRKKAEAVFSRKELIQFTTLSGGQCSTRRTKDD